MKKVAIVGIGASLSDAAARFIAAAQFEVTHTTSVVPAIVEPFKPITLDELCNDPGGLERAVKAENKRARKNHAKILQRYLSMRGKSRD